MVNIYAHKNTCKARRKIASGTTDEDESPIKKVKREHHSTDTISSEDETIQKFSTWMASLKGGFAR